MNVNLFERANQIIRGCDTAYFGVIDENGCPHVSTVSPIHAATILETYFSTNLDGNKARRLLQDKRTSICFRAGNDNITLVGEAEICTDQATKDKFWIDWFIHHFPLGDTDPNYCVIKFTTKRVSLWVDRQSAEFTIDQLLRVQSRCGLLCDFCTFKEPYNCGGCIETNGHPFHGECPVAGCCQERGHAHCGECADIPCEKLNEYSCGDSEHCDNPKGARIALCRAWA
ncbi:MAG: pyridoxamine 5'-phosphate oxidase family protein [Clostridiales bacterium]|nr:pyridoxamine 5'-phosphate oxidase family protein [Clostridiales bacterium]